MTINDLHLELTEVKKAVILANKKVLTIDELVEYTGIPKTTIYAYTSQGEIPHTRRGKRLFFDRERIDGWLLNPSSPLSYNK